VRESRARPRNLIVAQSGAIAGHQQQLRGLVEAARDLDAIGTVYAGWTASGRAKEELLDSPGNRTRKSPSCAPRRGRLDRHLPLQLREADRGFDRLIDVFMAHDIGYFCYIGGTTRWTLPQVASLAYQRGLDLIGVGVPKTIDNTSATGISAHRPHAGYASTARLGPRRAIRQRGKRGLEPGRPRAGPAAMGDGSATFRAAASPTPAAKCAPDLTRRAARQHRAARDQVNDGLKRHGRLIVVVSEGLQLGAIGEREDAFGHVQFSSSETTVAQIVVNALNQAGLPVQGPTRRNVPGTDQRHT